MKQTILVHGTPDTEDEFFARNRAALSDTNWFPWFKREMELRSEIVQALEFPKPYDPMYEEWVAIFEQMEISDETTLIGHSCGGGFLLRYLTEHPNAKPKQVILVAPWIDPQKEFTTNFFDFVLDLEIANRFPLDILISSNDQETVVESCIIIKSKIPNAIYHEFSNKGHFEELEFPELLKILK